MMFCERRVIPTSLDPIPRSMRASLGVVAMNNRELIAASRNGPDDQETIKEIIGIIQAEDMADANRTWIVKPRKVPANTAKLAPSHRLAMIHAIRAGKV